MSSSVATSAHSVNSLDPKAYELNGRRLFNEGLFLLLLAAVLTILAIVLWPSVEPLVAALIVAPLVYLLCHYPRVLSWCVPRRRHHLHSLAVCTIGAFLFATAAMSVIGEPRGIASVEALKLALAAACGAFAFLYAAVKIGTPTHVAMVVDCEGVSTRRKVMKGDDGVLSSRELMDRLAGGEKMEQILKGVTVEVDKEEEQALADRMNDIGTLCCRNAPGIWPDHFEVSQEGSVAWYLYGRPGTRVTILFDQGFDPFSPHLKNDENPSWFTGVVPANGASTGIPGLILAGPVVNPGRGAYRMIVDYPDGRSAGRIIHGGGSQRRG